MVLTETFKQAVLNSKQDIYKKYGPVIGQDEGPALFEAMRAFYLWQEKDKKNHITPQDIATFGKKATASEDFNHKLTEELMKTYVRCCSPGPK